MADLEEQVAAHLRTYPWLTAHEVSRALGRRSLGAVPKVLARMEAAGTAVHRETHRPDTSDPRPRIEWQVTR